MSDGLATPGAHDGMGVALQRHIVVGNEIVLVRNHERSTSHRPGHRLVVLETEDQGSANTLYRFLPNNLQGGLGSMHAGGGLQGLAVKGVANADLRFPTLCQKFQCAWVDIANPDLDGATLAVAGIGNVSASGPYRQAYANGAAIFGANEGCWVDGGVVYVTDKRVTTSPQPSVGRIWALHLATMTLEAIFVSDDILIGNSPDNLCISPRGGVMFCEDGGNNGLKGDPSITVEQLRLMGLTGHPRRCSALPRIPGLPWPLSVNVSYFVAPLSARGQQGRFQCVTSRHTVGPRCRLAAERDERPVRRIGRHDLTPNYVCCTLTGRGVATFLPLG